MSSTSKPCVMRMLMGKFPSADHDCNGIVSEFVASMRSHCCGKTARSFELTCKIRRPLVAVDSKEHALAGARYVTHTLALDTSPIDSSTDAQLHTHTTRSHITHPLAKSVAHTHISPHTDLYQPEHNTPHRALPSVT